MTHDIDEAIKLGDRIAVMRAGRLVQFGPPEELLRQPADPYVVDLFGQQRALKHLKVVGVKGHYLPLPVGQLTAAQPPVGKAISVDSSLEQAFLAMLESGAGEIAVSNAGGQVIGSLSIEALLAAGSVANR